MTASLLVAVLIVLVVISVVTSRLGRSAELRDESNDGEDHSGRGSQIGDPRIVHASGATLVVRSL